VVGNSPTWTALRQNAEVKGFITTAGAKKFSEPRPFAVPSQVNCLGVWAIGHFCSPDDRVSSGAVEVLA